MCADSDWNSISRRCTYDWCHYHQKQSWSGHWWPCPDTFKLVLDEFNKTLPITQYCGKYVLYGVDGSGFNIFFNPNDPSTYNPPSGKSKLGNNEIHVVASYRLSNLAFTDAIIQPCREKNEYSAVCDLIDNCTFDGGTPLLGSVEMHTVLFACHKATK